MPATPRLSISAAVAKCFIGRLVELDFCFMDIASTSEGAEGATKALIRGRQFLPTAPRYNSETKVDDDVSKLLRAWTSGDRNALEDLIPIVYAELRRLAHHY